MACLDAHLYEIEYMDLAEMINLVIHEGDDDLDVLEFLENGISRQIYERNNNFDTLDEVAFRRRFMLFL
jgi:hypothetical protein